MQRSTGPWLLVIAAITILVVYAVWPAWPGGAHPGLFGRPLEVRPGLDVQGGLRVLLEAESAQPVTNEQMDEVRRVIERRVNAFGVAEPVVQRAGANRIIVELPGVSDPQAAINLVQQTALLEFVDFARSPACTASMPADGQYILTDRQASLRATTAATAEATAAATSAATAEATAAATAEATSQPTAEVTAAATAEATQAATSAATAEATAAVTAEATSQPTAEATVAATAEATAAATTEATQSSMVRPSRLRPNQGTPASTAEPTAQPTAQPTDQLTAEATVVATSAATTDAAATAAATTDATPEATVTPVPTVSNVPGSKTNPLVNPCTGQPFRTVMTGAGLQSADPNVRSGSTDYVVVFTLAGNEEAQRFAAHTTANINQPMAIVLDGEVLSAPEIRAAITTNGEITGGFDRDEAINLAVQLRSGALPISLRIESTEQVGASLGAASVDASVRAGIVGVIVVLLFLLIFYRLPGLAAALALVLFAGINFALYKYIPVTLTLSAITGFLISIGTAVDGNILIFERIKEELRAGRPLFKAIDTGFARAWPSIRESNISTLMIGLILYFFGGQFGASAVRGFAVTLIIGLVTNLFTAVIVTRTFLNALVALRGERINPSKLFGD
jgi:protein-export membrane protein SecD